MDKLQRLAGVDVPIPELKVSFHQPTLKEIALVGEDNFFRAVQLFKSCDPEKFREIMINGLEGEELVKQEHVIRTNYTTPWSIFRFQVGSDIIVESSLKMFLLLAFPRLVNITLLQQPSIIQLSFKEDEKTRVEMLNENNFEALQRTVNFLFDTETEDDKKSGLNPIGEQAERIAEKIRLAQEKRNQSSDNGVDSANTSVIGTMASILASSDGISLQEVLDLTFPQLIIQMNRTTLLRSYSTQITLGAFGGLDVDDIVEWQKNL